MHRRTKIIVASAAFGIIAAAGAGVAVAAAGDDDDHERRITGPALERASAAALAHTGSGEVTETEVGDEESYYEVEVTLEDGTQMDVQLDEDFNVVGEETDSSETDDADEGSD